MERFEDVDGRQVEKRMPGCSKGVIQRLEMSVYRLLLAGMVARAVHYSDKAACMQFCIVPFQATNTLCPQNAHIFIF